ncbi:MAG: single-stranded DNA-binding protein [Planctomycetes bacterium]|nr:single-stranded DNA-binding protein [Planctomycetota bacterium]
MRTSRALSRAVGSLSFGAPVTHVYNPLAYARASHEEYLRRYAKPGCEALLLGMNPGPWGMAQTGVPFGEVAHVRDWLGISAPVKRPEPEHPARPVLGFDCERSEVSGARLWGWARSRFETPEAFFDRFFLWNFCPLAFLEESGRNRTPDKLPIHEREPLFAACDRGLERIVAHLQPRIVIGVGRFASDQAARVLEGAEVALGTILHPSPASPIANRGWAAQAERQLADLGLAGLRTGAYAPGESRRKT